MFLLCSSQVYPQISSPPPIIWSKCFGGSQNDGNDNQNLSPPSINIQSTNDFGYLISTRTASNNGDITGNHGGREDIWISKLDSSGNIQYSSCVGGDSTERGEIHIASNGDFYLFGNTTSQNGDFNDNHGNCDVFLRKYNSIGTLQWSKCYGGSLNDAGNVHFINDTLIFIVGYTLSMNGDITNYHGGFDVFIMRIDDANGGVISSNCIGGSGDDEVSNFIFTNQKIRVIGKTSSNDGDFSLNTNFRSNFGCILNLNLQIDTISILNSYVGQMNFTSDKGCLFSCQNSFPVNGWQQLSGWHGGEDIGLIKYDSLFNKQWELSVGGSSNDFGVIKEYRNGSFLIAGTTSSNDGDFSGNHGGYDAFLLKINKYGSIIWSKCYGGSAGDNHVTGPIVAEFCIPVIDTLQKHSSNTDKIVIFSCFRTSIDILEYFIKKELSIKKVNFRPCLIW